MLRRILIGIAVLSALVCVALLGTVVFFTSMKNLDGMPGHEVDVTEYKTIPQLTLRQRLGLGTASDAQHNLSAPSSATNTSPKMAGFVATPLQWTMPKTWRQAPERPMREVTFWADETQQVTCYVAVLGGNAGGLEANINRWCEQMGASVFTPEKIALLPQITVLGVASPLVALPKSQAENDQGLLGVVCVLQEKTVFVKMTGPAEQVQAERENFEAFCRSLQFEESK